MKLSIFVMMEGHFKLHFSIKKNFNFLIECYSFLKTWPELRVIVFFKINLLSHFTQSIDLNFFKNKLVLKIYLSSI